MPTTMVKQNHCGTKAPIWLKEAHPATDVVKSVQACVNIFDRRGGCFYEFGITVKNCNGITSIISSQHILVTLPTVLVRILTFRTGFLLLLLH